MSVDTLIEFRRGKMYDQVEGFTETLVKYIEETEKLEELPVGVNNKEEMSEEWANILDGSKVKATFIPSNVWRQELRMNLESLYDEMEDYTLGNKRFIKLAASYRGEDVVNLMQSRFGETPTVDQLNEFLTTCTKWKIYEGMEFSLNNPITLLEDKDGANLAYTRVVRIYLDKWMPEVEYELFAIDEDNIGLKLIGDNEEITYIPQESVKLVLPE